MISNFTLTNSRAMSVSADGIKNPEGRFAIRVLKAFLRT